MTLTGAEIAEVSALVMELCGILLDDNNRKPICRLHFNGSKKYVTLFDVEGGERVDIISLDDLYGMASRIRATVQKHEAKLGIAS